MSLDLRASELKLSSELICKERRKIAKKPVDKRLIPEAIHALAIAPS